MFVGIIIDFDRIHLYINSQSSGYTLLRNLYIEHHVEDVCIGGVCYNTGITGFIWSYFHTYNLSNFAGMVDDVGSLNCFYPGCDSCIPAIIDPIFNKICL